jgi:hypothetical protein
MSKREPDNSLYLIVLHHMTCASLRGGKCDCEVEFEPRRGMLKPIDFQQKPKNADIVRLH